jgi:hypothetical protein
MWTKTVVIDEKYDSIVSVLQSTGIVFKETIIDNVIGYDDSDTLTYNLRMLEYRDAKGNYIYWAETIFRYLDETKDDRIEAFLVPSPSDENSKGGWVTEWVIPGKGRIPKKKVELETQDFIFSKCRMQTDDIGTQFYGFVKEEFPKYDGKISFMRQPCGYQDDIGSDKTETPIAIEARYNKIDDEWVTANKDKIRNLFEVITKDKDAFYELFDMVFEYATTKLNLYSIYSFGTKIAEDNEGNKKTILYIKGAEKV